MSNPQVVPLSEGPFTQSRIGTVVVATPNSMTVNVGGNVQDVAFLLPFSAGAVAPPAAGTVVQIIRQDSSWVAVGRVVGAGSNSVLNPSFEESLPSSFPDRWFAADITGLSTTQVVDIVGAPDGDFAAKVYSGAAADHYLYSSPIPVTAGDIWSLSASVGGDYGGNFETADARLEAMWFATSTDLFPTVSSATITVDTEVDVPQYPPFRAMFGNVTAPVSGFMRVALRSTLNADQALVWDRVIARRA